MTIEQVREKIAEQFYGGYCELEDRTELDWREALSKADLILAIPELLIKDDDQRYRRLSTKIVTEDDLHKEHWVKVKEKSNA